MTTTITADNGSVSGSAGLKQAADSSGILVLQTGSGTAALTLDASQNATFAGKNTMTGSSSVLAAILTNSAEVVNIVAAAPSSTQTFYLNNGSVQYYTTNAANNWTVNIAMSSGTSLGTALAVGQSVTMAMLTTQGSTAYYNTAVQVDGSTTGVTTYWQGGTAPTKGNASGIDVYQYTVVKTASTPTYTVLASQVQY
jgi:hypothetical protein